MLPKTIASAWLGIFVLLVGCTEVPPTAPVDREAPYRDPSPLIPALLVGTALEDLRVRILPAVLERADAPALQMAVERLISAVNLGEPDQVRNAVSEAQAALVRLDEVANTDLELLLHLDLVRLVLSRTGSAFHPGPPGAAGSPGGPGM